jgi:uncharacterized protein (DUF924 family)
MSVNPADVVSFWLNDANDSPEALKLQSARWYRSDPDVDNEIRTEFGATLTQAESGQLDSWQQTAPGSVALVILLDQFTRNLSRGRATAWRNDTLALDIARSAVNTHSQFLGYSDLLLLYHPFHHAESRGAQQDAVRLFSELHDQAAAPWQPTLAGFRDFAINHAAIIQRFGRFPHRNQVLGRTSTPEEEEFLSQDKRRYGQ